MEYLGSAIVVFGILAAVAVATIVFEPASPFTLWIKLAEHYGTDRRPAQVTHPNEMILFASARGGFKSLGEGTTFDASIDDDGLWLAMKGNRPDGSASVLKIPGTHIRFSEQRGEQYRFDVFARPPVKVALYGDFGNAIMQRRATAD